MIVLIGGMYRSGSTFTFNISREILAKRGGYTTSLEAFDQPFSVTERENLIVKSHHPGRFLSDLVKRGDAKGIVSYRKPEDAIASWMHTFGFDLDQSVEQFRKWVEWHHSIKHNTLNIPFDMVEHSPLRAILGIQSYLTGSYNLASSVHLRVKYDKRMVKKTYDRLSENEQTQNIGFSHYDKETLFHRRHVSTGTRQLTQQESNFIRNNFREVVDAEGNYLV